MYKLTGRVLVYILLALVSASLAACAPIARQAGAPNAQPSAGQNLRTTSGNVVFDSASPLPDDAVLRVEVIDTSQPDYPANVVAAQEIVVGGSSPIAFEKQVDVSKLGSGNYVLVARILSSGATIFETLTDIPFYAPGASMEGIEIKLGPVAAKTATMGESTASAGVVGGRVTWEGGQALPEGAVLVVEIVDAKNAGLDAVPFASTQLGVSGATSPIPFELQVTQPDVQTNYLIRAQVFEGETMTWVTSGAQRWGTGDAPFTDFDLPIVPVEGAAAKADILIPSSAVITGTLAYLQRVALPPGAVAEVALVDLSVGTILSNQVMTTTGEQVPLPFSLSYDPASIAQEGQYGILAQISIDGIPTFATLNPVLVLTNGAPVTGVDLILDVTTAAMTAGQGEQLMSGSVTGEVTYRQRIALPPGAVLQVSLQDVSLADAPATVLSTQVITTTGEQVPIPFNLPFDPAQIDERFTYSVAARIEIDGSLAWINDTMTPVITHGNPTSDITITLVQVK